MFHYSIKEHVSYAQEKKKISYSVDFTVFRITRPIFFEPTEQLMTHPMHWYISENRLIKLDNSLQLI